MENLLKYDQGNEMKEIGSTKQTLAFFLLNKFIFNDFNDKLVFTCFETLSFITNT